MRMYALSGSSFRNLPIETYPNINSVWSAFENTLGTAFGMFSYAPVFTDYFYQALQSFYDDNVQYMEIRTTLPQVEFEIFNRGTIAEMTMQNLLNCDPNVYSLFSVTALLLKRNNT